jgi:hypothetical protein
MDIRLRSLFPLRLRVISLIDEMAADHPCRFDKDLEGQLR